MSATVGLLISASLLAAVVEPAAGAATTPPTPPPAAAAPAARALPPKTVEGLTVVAQLKQLYPEQLKRFCFQRTMRSMRTQMLNDQLLEGLSSDNPPPSTSFG